jgi:tetratricopeptide (TPR) repeat protein
MAALASRSADTQTRLEASRAALQAGARAAERSEQRHNAWYNLATLLASQGEADAVERCLRNAIAWAPNWFKPHWTLARLLHLRGRRDEALREAAAAVELNGGKHAEVIATWAAFDHASRRK